MVTAAAGSVVLVPFPFSDLSQSKLRPAAVLAGAGRDDWIPCQITSNPYGDSLAIMLTSDAFNTGTLRTLATPVQESYSQRIGVRWYQKPVPSQRKSWIKSLTA